MRENGTEAGDRVGVIVAVGSRFDHDVVFTAFINAATDGCASEPALVCESAGPQTERESNQAGCHVRDNDGE